MHGTVASFGRTGSSSDEWQAAEVSDSTWEYAGGKHIAGFWALNKQVQDGSSREAGMKFIG